MSQLFGQHFGPSAFTGSITRVACLATLIAFAAPLHGQATPASGPRKLTLAQAIDLAQQQGYAARAVASSRDAARSRERAFNARLLPKLGLGGDVPNVSRAIVPITQPDGTVKLLSQSQAQSSLSLKLSQTLPWTGSELFVDSRLTRLDLYGDSPSRQWQSAPLVVGLSQQIFRPNQLRWDMREQGLRGDIAERQFVEQREDVSLTTVAAFFDLYAATVALENAGTNAAVNDALYTLNKGRYEVGKIGENDLLQNELALLKSRTSLDGARLEHARALAELRRQLGLSDGADIEVEAPTTIPAVTADTQKAVTEALRNRSDLLNFDLQDVQARRRINDARLSNVFGATINATAGLNQQAPVFGDAYQSLLSQQRYAVTIDMPLVQWGAHHADVEAARADQNRIANTSRANREKLVQDAHFAALQLDLARRQLELSAKSDTVAAKRFDVAKNRYIIGKIGIDNLFIGQNEKDQARLAYVQALRGFWVAYHTLRRVTLYDFAAGQPIR
jgi:outer membrane protein